MGFFNKSKEKKDETNRLPSLPPLPNISEENSNKPILPPAPEPKKNFILPSFPSSNFGQKINQDVIKEAVNDETNNQDSNQNYQFIPSFQKPKTQEIPEIKPLRKIPQDISEEDSRTLEMSDWNQNITKLQQIETFNQRINASKIKKVEPLFIKLDKFENTISTFNEIKLKITEIESLLKNIREIKIKEERELNEWEKEIEAIKARLDQIDKEVFKLS